MLILRCGQDWSLVLLPPLHITAKSHRPCFQAAYVLVSIRSSIYSSKNEALSIRTEPSNILRDEVRVNVRPRNSQVSETASHSFRRFLPRSWVTLREVGSCKIEVYTTGQLKEAIGNEATGQESIVAHRWLAVRIGLGKCYSRAHATSA